MRVIGTRSSLATPCWWCAPLAVSLSACSGAPNAAPSDASSAATPPSTAATPVPTHVAPSAQTGQPVTGAAIAQWFSERGATAPRALDPEMAQCRTVTAQVPSGVALSCAQDAVIDTWARVTRRTLYDVRSGRTLVLLNLIERVAPGDTPPGRGCSGALVALRLELSADGGSLDVTNEPGCACGDRSDQLDAQAKSLHEQGQTRASTAVAYQAKEVRSACTQLGAYQWEEHGFVRAE